MTWNSWYKIPETICKPTYQESLGPLSIPSLWPQWVTKSGLYHSHLHLCLTPMEHLHSKPATNFCESPERICKLTEVLCGGFNENGFHRLMCLNAWTPVSRIVWEELEHVVLLRWCVTWGVLGGFKSPYQAQSHCLSPTCLWIKMEVFNFCSSAIPGCLPPCCEDDHELNNPMKR